LRRSISSDERDEAEPGMSDIADTVTEAVEHGQDSKLNTAVAFLVAMTATVVALCNVKDGNVTQAMAQAQMRAVDEWSYYQAKGTKQSLAEAALDQLIIQRDIAPNLSGEAREFIDKSIATYTAKTKHYEAEKAEIKAKAEGFEREYDALNTHDDQFDMAEASMSVGIALFGVTALTKKRWLLGVASVFAGFGALLGIAGFAGWNLHPDWLAKLLS
jgi:hypothetical protein